MEKEYFAERFKKMNNEEVVLEMRRARSNPGVTRSRINYQVALQEEVELRYWSSWERKELARKPYFRASYR